MADRKPLVSLVDAVEAIRRDLLEVQQKSKNATEMPFEVGAVEIELGVELADSGGGHFGINVYAVKAGIKGEQTRTASHRIRLTLHPVDPATGDRSRISGQRRTDPSQMLD